MNFERRTHDVLAGRVTQYRVVVREPRPVKRPGPRGTVRTGKSAVRWSYPSEPRVGRVFAISQTSRDGDGRRYTVRVASATITAVRREWLGQIDFAGARAEGHRTTDDFRVAWVLRHDGPAVRRAERWALCVLGEDGLRSELIARFHRHHAAHEVWVVSFRISEGRDRFLAPGASGDERGYTMTPGLALDRDAPCVDEFTQAAFAKRAEAQRAGFRAALEAERAERKAAKKMQDRPPPWKQAA